MRSDGNPSPVIAELNGELLHRNQFDGYVSQEREFLDGDTSGKVRSRLLDRLIREKLIQQEVKNIGLQIPAVSKAGAAVTSNEVQELSNIVENYQLQVVLKDVSVSGDEIESYFQQNQVRFSRQGGFYLSDIRVADRAQAETLYRQLTKLNGDFAQLAKEFSSSPTAADGGLRYYEDGQLPPVFDEVVHHLNPGQVSTIVTTEYGFHIFRLERRAER